MSMKFTHIQSIRILFGPTKRVCLVKHLNKKAKITHYIADTKKNVNKSNIARCTYTGFLRDFN